MANANEKPEEVTVSVPEPAVERPKLFGIDARFLVLPLLTVQVC